MKNPRSIILTVSLFLSLFVGGCVQIQREPKEKLFEQHYKEQPKSILVLPPINETTAAEAKQYYSATIGPAVSTTGYYVYPVEVISQLMKAEGSYHQNVKKVPPKKFQEVFGADAVLYITITEWNKTYLVLAANVKVGLRYELVSTKTGKMLWAYEDTVVRDTSGSSGGGGLAGLAANAVSTAIQTASTRYIAVARDVNNVVLKTIPKGKYHEEFQKDKKQKVNVKQIPSEQLKPNSQSSETTSSSSESSSESSK